MLMMNVNRQDASPEYFASSRMDRTKSEEMMEKRSSLTNIKSKDMERRNSKLKEITKV